MLAMAKGWELQECGWTGCQHQNRKHETIPCCFGKCACWWCRSGYIVCFFCFWFIQVCDTHLIYSTYVLAHPGLQEKIDECCGNLKAAIGELDTALGPCKRIKKTWYIYILEIPGTFLHQRSGVTFWFVTHVTLKNWMSDFSIWGAWDNCSAKGYEPVAKPRSHNDQGTWRRLFFFLVSNLWLKQCSQNKI